MKLLLPLAFLLGSALVSCASSPEVASQYTYQGSVANRAPAYDHPYAAMGDTTLPGPTRGEEKESLGRQELMVAMIVLAGAALLLLVMLGRGE